MAILEQIKADLQGAMRAGEKERVGALRLVLSELQKAAKEGSEDELAVLRRERKRRLEAAAAYREAGRDDLADGEEAEAELIAAYLPAELSEQELAAIVEQAVRESGAASPKDMGAAMKQRDGGRRRARRRQARVRAGAGGAAGMRTQIELPNEVAAELAGSQDAVLRALEAHLDCKVFLRGNLLTLDGEESETQRRRARRARALRADRARPPDRAGHDRRRDGRARRARIARARARGRRVEPSRPARRAEDGQPEALRRLDPRRARSPSASGPAGTGKTFLAVAMAAAALSRHEVNRIILTRPAVEAGERLGFLPGDLMAKVDPYLRPLFDALHDMLDPEKVSQHIERGVIEIAPLAFMRGRTLNDSFVILDEAQNTTPEQMKMFLTRLGFGSRMVVTGDITQVDLPREQQSGLIVVGEVLDEIEGIEFVRFGGEDVVRHKLVQRIVEAYDEHAQRVRARRARRARPSQSGEGARAIRSA